MNVEGMGSYRRTGEGVECTERDGNRGGRCGGDVAINHQLLPAV